MWNSFPVSVKFVRNNFREALRVWTQSSRFVSTGLFLLYFPLQEFKSFSPSCELNPLNFLLLAFMSFFFSSFLVLNWDNLLLLSPFKSLFSFMSQPVSRSVLSVKQVVTFLCFSLYFNFYSILFVVFFYIYLYFIFSFLFLLHIKCLSVWVFCHLKHHELRFLLPAALWAAGGSCVDIMRLLKEKKEHLTSFFLCAKAQFHAAFIVCGKLQLYNLLNTMSFFQ